MGSVTLNWETASAQLLTSLKEVWADNGFSNVTLVFEDESSIQTNRTLLAAVSPVMRNFLKMNAAPNCQIMMFGIESSLVKALLDFIFTEEISIEQEKLELFFSTASKLKVDGFMEIGNGNANTEKQQTEIKPGMDWTKVELMQEVIPTMNELNTTDYTPLEFERADIHSLKEEVPLLCSVDPLNTVHPDKVDSIANQKNDGRIKRKVEVDEIIVKKDKGISCIACKTMEVLDHDKFLTLEELHQHEKEVHSRKDRSGIYNCEQCGQEFFKLVNFNQHKRKMHPENPNDGRISCNVCGRSFKTKASMEKHKDFSHPVPGKVFKCKMPNCKKESMTKNASNVHYYQSHSERQRKEFEGKL